MKHIAIFQDNLKVGGVQKALINILREIDYSRCQVDLYLFDEGSFFDMPAFENLRVIHLNSKFASLDRLVYFNLLYRFARDVTQGKFYDVAVDFNSYQNACAVGVLKSKARKKIMWIHNDMEIKLKNEPKYRVLWHFFKNKLNYYDEFAAVSPGIIDGFRKVSGIQDKSITPIPNHIDTEEIFRKKDLPVDFYPDPEKLNLCSVGRICHQKGYDLLVNYLAQVKKIRRDFHFYLIGDGPDKSALENQIKNLDLKNNITLLGNQANPFCYMDKMDGFVLTSRYEGQGMVIREAQALGLPLYISKNLEPYNPGIAGYENIPEALIHAEKPERKIYNNLSAYNAAITQSLNRILGLS